MNQSSDKQWSRDALIALDSTVAEQTYDDFAPTYNTTLDEWGYTAPSTAAQLLQKYMPAANQPHIIDAGCGTGLTGRALHTQGYTHITGLDISQKSLDLAATLGVYTATTRHDMQQFPYPFDDNTFDA
ncbi:MAG: methyltransferase domain-containing protein, partial [Chloroflexota bacterium]